jgi:hypothetical protein
MSASPDMICCMPSATARRPEPHSWFRPPGRRFLRDAGGHRRLAGRVLALAGGEDLAHDHFVDLLRRNTGALERCLDGDRAQIMGGNGRQSAVERPDRGAGGTGDNDMMDFPVMYCEKLF